MMFMKEDYMKRIISVSLLVFLLLAIGVTATSVPNPISGFINVIGDRSGYTVYVENMESGVVKSDSTDLGGGYMTSWGRDVWDGDRVKVTVAACSQFPACTKILTFGKDMLEVPTFNINSLVEPKPCPHVVPCDSCCPTDTTPYAECDSCAPACPEPVECLPEANEENCAEYIPEPEECPDVTINYIIGAIVAFIVTMGAGGGLKIYKKRGSEEVAVLHKHRGIRSYHSPNIVHRNPIYSHKKGDMFPKLPKEV